MLILRHALEQQAQHLLGVADDVVVGLDIFVDLGAVDVDVDDLGLPRERVGLEGHAVGEAAAHRDQQVAVVNGHVRGDGAVHADHAGCERVAPGNAAAAHDRDGAGGVDSSGKGAELLVRAAAHHAAAADEHRLFGLGDHLDEGVHVVEIRLWHLQAAGVGAAIERGKVARWWRAARAAGAHSRIRRPSRRG